MNKTEILALPWQGWGAEQTWWRSLLIVPTRKKHDSGWAHIAIVGADADGVGQMILAYPDDIHFPGQTGVSPRMPDYGSLRMDAFYPSGVLRLWSREYEFSIISPTSSVDIEVRRVPKPQDARNE